ncbi:uncharacterized protein LOC134855912, partial [Symsagittifera roscoffensis]|uniref:uncharacterized protein LOC134855912 n=1 Tax=Symsagittifera roscoffensis TaxID=84072 RepID=UPI00307C9267
SRKYLLGRKASVISNPASETAFVYSNGLFASHFKDPLASTKDYPMHEINTISSHVEKKSSAPSAQPLGMYLRSILERDTDRYQALEKESDSEEDDRQDSSTCNADIVIIDQNYWRTYPREAEINKDRLNFISAHKFRLNSELEDYLSSDPENEDSINKVTEKSLLISDAKKDIVKPIVNEPPAFQERKISVADETRYSKSCQTYEESSIAYSIESTKPIEIKENVSVHQKFKPIEDDSKSQRKPQRDESQTNLTDSDYPKITSSSESQNSAKLSRNVSARTRSGREIEADSHQSDFEYLKNRLKSTMSSRVDSEISLHRQRPMRRNKKKVLIDPHISKIGLSDPEN